MQCISNTVYLHLWVQWHSNIYILRIHGETDGYINAYSRLVFENRFKKYYRNSHDKNTTRYILISYSFHVRLQTAFLSVYRLSLQIDLLIYWRHFTKSAEYSIPFRSMLLFNGLLVSLSTLKSEPSHPVLVLNVRYMFNSNYIFRDSHFITLLYSLIFSQSENTLILWSYFENCKCCCDKQLADELLYTQHELWWKLFKHDYIVEMFPRYYIHSDKFNIFKIQLHNRLLPIAKEISFIIFNEWCVLHWNI